MSDQSIGVYKVLCREIEVKKSVIATVQDGSGELDECATSDNEVRQAPSIISKLEADYVSVAPTVVRTRART